MTLNCFHIIIMVTFIFPARAKRAHGKRVHNNMSGHVVHRGECSDTFIPGCAAPLYVSLRLPGLHIYNKIEKAKATRQLTCCPLVRFSHISKGA